MSVEFHDFSIQAKEALSDAVIAALHEVAGELTSKTKRLTKMNPKDGHDVRGNWKYRVDEAKQEAVIGNPLEASYWEELGTGEYALNKDGRKGWWVYIKGGSGYAGKTKTYSSQKEAEEAAAYISQKHGVQAIATNGREPNRPLFRAFTSEKEALIRIMQARIGELMK